MLELGSGGLQGNCMGNCKEVWWWIGQPRDMWHAGVGVAGILALALGAESVTLTDYGSQVDTSAECVALPQRSCTQWY